ncbi:MAG TPA: Co2+/Mg2+ efflux protein ApaG [Alphaproteobacteria bacterium]|nr:Co2+/Mg2+ efflux protein ApaG [Rhodospirillaceae bacterium]HRJ12365.1 Co2+/Mg2+ efflux protein ApaG [Alphaproteobacteria bacterium]
MYHAKTHGITVKVQPEFLEHQSDPTEDHYVWAYHVRIENGSEGAVQLLSRTWEVIDAFGNIRHISGEGVVGMQPLIAATEFFEYNSGTSLKTPSGFMRGTYQLEDEDGNEFDIDIPIFSLDSHYQNVVLQ